MNHCHFCGKILHEVPYECHRCGNIFCSKHHLPENHHCPHKFPHFLDPEGKRTALPKKECYYCGVKTSKIFYCPLCGREYCSVHKLHQDHYRTPEEDVVQSPSNPETKNKKSKWHIPEKIKVNLTLKNFAIFSFVLMLIGLLPMMYLSFQNGDLCYYIYDIGFLCFLASYFIYAVDHWRIHNRILALFMIAVPLIAAYFSSTKISDPTNILIYFAFILGICAVVSVILLVIGEKIYWAVWRYILKIKSRNHWYSFPKISYAIFGMVFVSLIIINSTSASVFSDNFNVVTHSITGSIKNSPSGATSPNPYVTQYPTASVTVINPSILSPLAIPTKNLETGFASKSFAYVLRGKSGSINVDMYSGVYNEIASRPSPAACTRYDYDNSPCNAAEIKQYYLKYLDNPTQKKYLDGLISSIKSKTSNKDDQARIAINLVQRIPYDYSRLYSTNFKMRTPYEVLYENTGVCSEKSLLLAYLLRELGYGVVLFEFSSENHMAVGIKSPSQYDFKNSGYAFVETAASSIPTDDQADYVGAGKLTSTPQIFQISDGNSFSSISEEYRDAQNYNAFINIGSVLDAYSYSQWISLVQKYGIEVDTSSSQSYGSTSSYATCNANLGRYCSAGSNCCQKDGLCYLSCSRGTWDSQRCVCIV